MLGIGCRGGFPWQGQGQNQGVSVSTSTSTSNPASAPPTETEPAPIRSEAKIQITDSIREWDYGDYEGLTSAQIREQRLANGLDPNWDIWRDGCPGGEGPADVTSRLDGLIGEIRGRWQEGVLRTREVGTEGSDVLLVAHGHILRAFAMRWIGRELTEGVSLLLDGEFRLVLSCLVLLCFAVSCSTLAWHGFDGGRM